MELEDWKKNIESISKQLNDLNIHSDKEFRSWIQKHPKSAQLLIHTLLNMMFSVTNKAEETKNET